jgi:hypothetical protein
MGRNVYNLEKERLRKGIVKHPCKNSECKNVLYRKYNQFYCSEDCKFWGQIKKEDCWLWTGELNMHGYGVIFLNYKEVSAHRYSYKKLKSEIPENMYVLHTCDIRKCVNPEHLFLGNAKDNAIDAMQKDRLRKGSSVGTSKLTEDQVREIRRLHEQEGLKYNEISKNFCITQDMISKIIRRKAWCHI